MRVTGRRFGLAIAAVMVLTTATPVGPVSAVRPTAKVSDLDTIEATLRAMEESGTPTSQIDATMKAQFGWERQPGTVGTVVAAAPTASHVTLYASTVWKDTATNHWVARATWAWKDCTPVGGVSHCWYTDDKCNSIGNCGGPDGFGIKISRLVNRRTTKFYTYTEEPFYEESDFVNPEAFNDAGASFTEQDSATHFGSHYNWDKGSIYFYFDIKTCTAMKGKAWVLDSRMSHTWPSTAVTGFGVAVDGFSISWNDNAGHWTGMNPNPYYWYPCGK